MTCVRWHCNGGFLSSRCNFCLSEPKKEGSEFSKKFLIVCHKTWCRKLNCNSISNICRVLQAGFKSFIRKKTNSSLFPTALVLLPTISNRNPSQCFQPVLAQKSKPILVLKSCLQLRILYYLKSFNSSIIEIKINWQVPGAQWICYRTSLNKLKCPFSSLLSTSLSNKPTRRLSRSFIALKRTKKACETRYNIDVLLELVYVVGRRKLYFW